MHHTTVLTTTRISCVIIEGLRIVGILDGIVEVVRYIGMICLTVIQRFKAFKTVVVTAIEVL